MRLFIISGMALLTSLNFFGLLCSYYRGQHFELAVAIVIYTFAMIFLTDELRKVQD